MSGDDRGRQPPGWQEAVVWRAPDGSVVSRVEKLKALRENLREIESSCRDAFEDALLMGCDEEQVRDGFRRVVEGLRNPWRR